MQLVGTACPLLVRTLRVLADEQQAFLRAILLARVAAQGTGLAGIVRIHLDGNRPRKRGFIGDRVVQFGESPLGNVAICSARLSRDGFGALSALLASSRTPFGALTNLAGDLQHKDFARLQRK